MHRLNELLLRLKVDFQLLIEQGGHIHLDCLIVVEKVLFSIKIPLLYLVMIEEEECQKVLENRIFR